MSDDPMDTSADWEIVPVNTTSTSTGESDVVSREYTGSGSAARIFEWNRKNGLDASGHEPVIKFVLNSSRPNVITK